MKSRNIYCTINYMFCHDLQIITVYAQKCAKIQFHPIFKCNKITENIKTPIFKIVIENITASGTKLKVVN